MPDPLSNMFHRLSIALFWFTASYVTGVAHSAPNKPTSLYVFGDSYADTGNHNTLDPAVWQPWKTPYGRTWPGNPTGRFSDGMVLTDFIANFLNISSPPPYRERDSFPERLQSGVNFAYGGSGVSDTYGPQYTNISAQIDQFEQLMKGRTVDFGSSLVLFVYGGNDYSVHIQKNGIKGIPFMITTVVGRLTAELRRLQRLGFRSFAVTNLEPAGCLPFITMPSSMQNCSRTDNVLSSVHNRLLSQSLATLKTLSGSDTEFTLLDQYKSFLDVLSSGPKYGFSAGLLQSCCQGIQKGARCGSVDNAGNPLYEVCPDAQKTFFWDGVHPTQAGWSAVTQQYRDLFG